MPEHEPMSGPQGTSAASNVHEFPPLAIAQVRVTNGLHGLNEVDRATVLAWAVAETMLRFPDPNWSSVDFLSDVWAKMDALASAPAATAS